MCFMQKESNRTRLLSHCIWLNKWGFHSGRKEGRKTTANDLPEDLSVYKWNDNKKLQSCWPGYR